MPILGVPVTSAPKQPNATHLWRLTGRAAPANQRRITPLHEDGVDNIARETLEEKEEEEEEEM